MPTLAGLGTFLGGAASLGGALFGGSNQTGSVNYNRDMHQKDWRNFGEAVRQYEESKDFAKDVWSKSVRTRVADAKAAGIHPLFALGASLPGASFGSTVSSSGFPGGSGSSGRDPFAAAAYGLEAMGRGAQSMRKPPKDPNQAELAALNLRRARAQTLQDEALAVQMRSDASTAATRAASSRDGGDPLAAVESSRAGRMTTKAVPVIEAGDYQWPATGPVKADLDEVLGSVIATAYRDIVKPHRKRSGPGWRAIPLAPLKKGKPRRLSRFPEYQRRQPRYR
jgi:hypothetical protein